MTESRYIEEKNGGYYIKGKRVSLDSVIHGFRQGEDPESIRDNFPVLTLTEVYGALTFYLENRPELDEYMRRMDEKWAELKRNAKPPSAEFLARIEKAKQMYAARMAFPKP